MSVRNESDIERHFRVVFKKQMAWVWTTLNPYLRHFGNVMERHLWTKNPQSHLWFWWRHTSIKIFYFMLIWNLLSSTNCTPLGLITWRHHPEISRDEHKRTQKPGNMVERHLWTKSPHMNGNVVERHLWTKNPQQIMAYDFLDFRKYSYLGLSWSVICGQKIHSYFY